MINTDIEFSHVIIVSNDCAWQEDKDEMFCGSNGSVWKHDVQSSVWYQSDLSVAAPVLPSGDSKKENANTSRSVVSYNNCTLENAEHQSCTVEQTPVKNSIMNQGARTARKTSGAVLSEIVQQIPDSTRYKCLTCSQDFADRYIATTHAKRHEFQGISCPLQNKDGYTCDAYLPFKRADQLMTHWTAKHKGISRNLCQKTIDGFSNTGKLTDKQKRWLRS